MAENLVGVDIPADKADAETIRIAEQALLAAWQRKYPGVAPARRERVEDGHLAIEYFANG